VVIRISMQQVWMSRSLDSLQHCSVERLALDCLARIAARKGASKTIRFPDVFSRICPLLCVKKAEAWGVLRTLGKRGDIEIVPYHGVRIKSAGTG